MQLKQLPHLLASFLTTENLQSLQKKYYLLLNNYRPISLLPVIRQNSKGLLTLNYVHLLNHMIF